MYPVSHSTRGIDTASHRRVRLDAVWHHVVSPISEGEGGVATAMVSETARLARDLEGDELTSRKLGGAGDAVRDALLVGEGSVAGKLPRGCWRVATMVKI